MENPRNNSFRHPLDAPARAAERRMSMKTRNEVIQALKCCLINEGDPCEGCPYYREDGYCIDNVMADALELLQESAEGE